MRVEPALSSAAGTTMVSVVALVSSCQAIRVGLVIIRHRGTQGGSFQDLVKADGVKLELGYDGIG